MVSDLNLSWGLDGWIVLAGALSAVASSLLGCFLVLRRMSMLGDAISHAVLPGLAAAFLLSESRSSIIMFLGAVIVGVLTAMLTEWIRGYGNVDEGASMGVVFTTLFALGLVLIVQAADHVDLDASCVLYGAIETIPLDMWSIWGWDIPRVVVILSGVTLLNLLFVIGFYKELALSSFDPALATAMGLSAKGMHYLLMTLVAVTAVACFESVGNILVVAMMVVPPAAAYMLTHRLGWMLVISCGIGIVSAAGGHWAALQVPRWFHFSSTTTAGMMAVATGLCFLAAALFSPHYGVLVRLLRQQTLSFKILCDDILAFVYRQEEAGSGAHVDLGQLQHALLAGPLAIRLATRWHAWRDQIVYDPNGIRLTRAGEVMARRLIRSHRLWEQYLVDHVDVASEKTHDKAERFEHFTDAQLRRRLEEATRSPEVDPHGKPIPESDQADH
jgi:manganese/zinc/iron transport system permease protein